MNLVNYRLVNGVSLPPQQGLYEYCLAANGVFVRAQREGLYACIPVSLATEPIRGLVSMYPEVRLLMARVSAKRLNMLFYDAVRRLPNENMTWLFPAGNDWTSYEPEQIRTPVSCRPLDPNDPFGARALIDLHSHNSMPAFFSGTDDLDESGGFRIFAVLGRVSRHEAEIRVRVGIYGHFYDIQASEVFQLPDWIRDVNEVKYDHLHSAEFEFAEL